METKTKVGIGAGSGVVVLSLLAFTLLGGGEGVYYCLHEHTCIDFEGFSWDKGSALKACNTGNLLEGKCEKKDLVGQCVEGAGTDEEVVWNYFSGIFTHETAGSHCKEENGVFSKIEIQQINYERNYPPVITGYFGSASGVYETLKDSNEVEKLKDTNLNTIGIEIPFKLFENGSYYQYVFDERVDESVRIAKKNGFAVLIVPSFIGPDFNDMEINLELDEFLEVSKKISLEWAERAEEYKAEYYSPQNEFDGVIRTKFPDTDEVKTIEEFHKDILPELKNKFSGKLFVKTSQMSTQYDFSGYDVITQTIHHQALDLEKFRASIKKTYKTISTVAENSNADWIVGEFWMPYSESFKPFQNIRNSVSIKQFDSRQDDYYQIGADEYLEFEDSKKPIGFMFHPWSEVKDRDAEDVVRDFFEEIL
ncbi:hypothetical protein ACFL0X_01010 [Nanoarchaeota archaeon]